MYYILQCDYDLTVPIYCLLFPTIIWSRAHLESNEIQTLTSRFSYPDKHMPTCDRMRLFEPYEVNQDQTKPNTLSQPSTPGKTNFGCSKGRKEGTGYFITSMENDEPIEKAQCTSWTLRLVMWCLVLSLREGKCLYPKTRVHRYLGVHIGRFESVVVEWSRKSSRSRNIGIR